MSEFLYSISPSMWNHFLLSLGRWLSAVSNPFHCEENISQLLSVPVKTDQSCLVFFCSLDPITMTKTVWNNKFEHGPIPRMRQSPIILDPLGLPKSRFSKGQNAVYLRLWLWEKYKGIFIFPNYLNNQVLEHSGFLGILGSIYDESIAH